MNLLRCVSMQIFVNKHIRWDDDEGEMKEVDKDEKAKQIKKKEKKKAKRKKTKEFKKPKKQRKKQHVAEHRMDKPCPSVVKLKLINRKPNRRNRN